MPGSEPLVKEDHRGAFSVDAIGESLYAMISALKSTIGIDMNKPENLPFYEFANSGMLP